MFQDFRYGARMLRKNPGFTSFALLALAIGIGANTTMFSVVNHALLKPPAYRDPNRLVVLQSVNLKQEVLEGFTSWDDFLDLRAQSKSTEGISGLSPGWSFTVRGPNGPEAARGQWVSASLFPTLGVSPVLGRSFTEAEDQPGAIQAAILSFEFWQRAFGGASNIVGSQVRIDSASATVIGVMPRGFHLFEDADLWVPLTPNPINQRGRGVRYLNLVGRLRTGATIEQASSELNNRMAEFESRYPNSNTGFSLRLVALREHLTSNERPILLLLGGAVGLVLLIACANVANLMLTRTLARRQEIAIRVALGARRVRLIRQLVLESLLLSVIGGALGTLLATWGVSTIRVQNWKGLSILSGVEIDPAVLAYTVFATLLSAVIIGFAPALRLSGLDPSQDLRGDGRSATTSASGQRLRSVLMISEIALTTVLLASSGLLVRSLIRLLDVNPGFDPKKVLTFQVNLPSESYGLAPQRAAFYERLTAEIRSLPGVLGTGVASRLPFRGNNVTTTLAVEGKAVPDGNLPSVDYRIASDSYFATLGIPLLEGRLADPRNPLEVNVNRTSARRFWPGESAVGKRVNFTLATANVPWMTVVGVVGDVHHLALDVAPRPEAYRPYVANPLGSPVFVVRSSENVDHLAAAIRARLRALDPQLPMFFVYNMEQLLADSLEARRLAVAVLAAFAGVALLLAALGLYGVVSYAAGLRTHEIGIRVALGAQRAEVARMVLLQGGRLVFTGLAAGLLASLAIGPLLARQVYGIGSRDPVALLAAAVVLLVAGLAACYFPARRAAELDPMTALRT